MLKQTEDNYKELGDLELSPGSAIKQPCNTWASMQFLWPPLSNKGPGLNQIFPNLANNQFFTGGGGFFPSKICVVRTMCQALCEVLHNYFI